MSDDTQRPAEISDRSGLEPMPTPPPRKRRRGLLRWPLLVAGPVLVLAVGGYIYLNSGRIAKTDNAYVKADMVPISTAVPGIVIEVAVDENQRVAAGDLLFKIDPETYKLARERASAQLEAVASFVSGLRASYAQALAQLELANTEVRYAERDVERERSLRERGLGSESDLDDAQHKLDTARQQIPIVEQRIAQLKAQLGGQPHFEVESHPAYRTAKVALEDAEVDLGWTTVRAPFDGVVSHVPMAGIYAMPGAPVLSIVANENLWIEANFKETELTHVAVGQPVVIHVDTYKTVDLEGRVESISPATGAEFSVIPAQNASGNWVKVAQRIPVRIRLDAPPGDITLRAGMSAIVEIDTGFQREAPPFLSALQRSPKP
jgi:membrane fusion protein (multidrug efflux system)